MYDIIGDIHGHAASLKELLFEMGYTEHQGVWKHPQRKVLFVGDYIDRGPAIRETLQLVKNMCDAGLAVALMGNHEYNALAYHHQKPDGSYLRPHLPKYTNQHAQTLAQFFFYQQEWQQYLEWFYTLPLFVELEGLRAVHACWDQEHIDWFKQQGLQTINPGFLEQAHIRGSEAYHRIDETLKGKEVEIGEPWNDKDGNPRTANRLKWWHSDFAQVSFDHAVFNCPEGLKQQTFFMDNIPVPYPREAPPVFCGHYWLEANTPAIQAPNVVCLDYSIAKEGLLVAYRWNGEAQLDNKNFVWVKQTKTQ